MSKKFYLLTMAMAVVLLSALGFASCVSETETLEGDPSAIVTRGVTFNIQLPSGDPVHFTRTTSMIDNEYAIHSLYLLVFDANSDLLTSKVSIDVNNDLGGNVASGDNWSYTYNAGSGESSAIRAVMVANDDMSDLVENTTTYASLATRQIQKALTASCNQATLFGTGLPMYGVAKTTAGHEIIPLQTTTQGATQPVNVTMTRCVARIDVYNAVDGLTIKSLSMRQLNPTGYLKPHDANAVPGEMVRVGGVTAFNPPTDPWLVGDSDGEPIPSQKRSFYIYEEQATADATAYPILQIEGELENGDDDIPVFYEVPFLQQNLATPGTTGTSIQITRNTIYKVQISGAASVNSRINLSITSTEAWSDFETTNESVGSDLLEGAANYTANTRTFDAGNTAHAETIQVVNGNTAHITGLEVLMDGASSWSAKVTDAATETGSAGDWLRAQFADGGQTATLTLTANTGDARVASVRVTYTDSNNATKVVIFTVNQAAGN